MPYYQRTNEEIIRNLRYSREYYHRWSREYFFRTSPLTLSPDLPLPQFPLEHIQDSCNKSIPIYFLTSPSERRTGDATDIIYTVYEHWFRGHDIDIDFGNFVAKLIKFSSGERPTVEDLLKIHQAWCEHVAATLPLISNNKEAAGAACKDNTYRYDHGPVGINEEQHMHYKLRPLFRALIMITDEHAGEKGAGQTVHLVRTDITSELSAPISFEGITPRFEKGLHFGSDDDKMVTTTLSAAIDFVMALEMREQTAFPERQRDPNLLDEKMADFKSPNELARSQGYTAPEIRGPSTGCVKLAEGEDVLPPVTHVMLCQRFRLGLPQPLYPRLQRLPIKKDSQIG